MNTNDGPGCYCEMCRVWLPDGDLESHGKTLKQTNKVREIYTWYNEPPPQ